MALVALEVVVASPQTGTIAQLFALPATWARWLIDPTVPAIPDHSAASAAPTSAPAVAKLPGSTRNPVVTTGI